MSWKGLQSNEKDVMKETFQEASFKFQPGEQK